MLSFSHLQGPHGQSSNVVAHDSKARAIQQSEVLDTPNIVAEPSPPNFEPGRLSTFAKHHGPNPKTFIAPSPLQKTKPSRTCSPSNEFTSSKQRVFTPAQVYPIASSRSTTAFRARKSASAPLHFDPHAISPPPYSKHSHMNSDTEDDRDEVGMIYTSRIGSQPRASSQGLRSRIFGLASTSTQRVRDKPISTTPGVMCAGETETETDEPVSIVYRCCDFPVIYLSEIS